MGSDIQKEIEQLVTMVFEKNLMFLKDNYEELYKQINNLSNNINTGLHKEKYALEVINSNFDILNLDTGGYLYAENSYFDAAGRASYNDFSENSSFNLLRQNPITKELLKGKDFKDILPIVDCMNEVVNFNEIEFNKIFKMIFIGTGLGYHILEIYKKLNPKIIYIIEPDIELFRLSMFTIDYTEFAQGDNKLFFSVGENKQKRELLTHLFFSHENYLNFNIKYYKLFKSYDYIYDELVNFFSINSATNFPYSKSIKNLSIIINLIKNKKRFFDVNLISAQNYLKNKKVLLISAGPSLDNYLDWIKINQSKFIVTCVDVIAKKLEKNGIVPDIVFSIDPSELCAGYLNFENQDFLKNGAIFFLAQQHEETLEVVENQNIYFSQSLPVIEEIGFLDAISNVGTYSFAMMCELGAKELYLIGCDAAFNQETGERYSKDSSYKQKDQIVFEKEDDSQVFSNDILELKGNLREIVKTNRELLAFKTNYENYISHKNLEAIKAYNLSNGLYIEGLEPLSRDDLDKKLINSKNIDKEIKNFMDSISVQLDDQDFENDIKAINTILNRVKKYQNKKFKTKDQFLQEKLDIMIWILEFSKNNTHHVIPNLFLTFISLSDIYVNFFFNLKQKNIYKVETVNKIAVLWNKGLYNLFKDIKNSLDS